jgi:sulfate permease, SulP family
MNLLGSLHLITSLQGVILEPLNAEYEVGYMFYAFILAGIVQVVIGVGRVAKVVRLIPVSVMTGFVNGLAIVLLLGNCLRVSCTS